MTVRLIARTFALGLTAVLAACSGSTTPAGQGSAPTAAPASSAAPAAGQATVQGDLLKDWQDQKDMMMKIADAMPEDKFGYKSTPAQRSYGEQVMHVALVNVDLLKALGGATVPPSVVTEGAKAKADVLKALAASYDYGTALLKEQSDATINGTLEASFLGPSTRARVFWTLLSHSMDVYGQIVVYLRLNGIVPPASRV